MGTFFHPTDQQWSIPAGTTNYEVSVVDAVLHSDVELETLLTLIQIQETPFFSINFHRL